MITDVIDDMLPLYAQKQAQDMVCERWGSKVKFTLIVPDRMPTECVWLDPSFGMFTVKGKEDKGFIMVKQLEPGSFIINQRYDDND